jgi:phenylalanyl-tRNA synthetase beta chain
LGEAADYLSRLGCTVNTESDQLVATAPTWRHDLSIPEDLTEEVLRLRGYDRIPSALPPLEGHPEPLSHIYQHPRQVARRLANLGFHQTVTLGFISPEADALFAGPNNPAAGRTLANPLGMEYSVMRSSLLSSLKVAAELNLRQGAKDVRLFEIAPVFFSGHQGPKETMALGLVWAGTLGGEDFLTKARAVQPADLLGIAKDLGCRDRLQVRELSPGLLALEIPLDDLDAPKDRVIPTFTPFSRFPALERDLSLLVDLDLHYRVLSESMSMAVLMAAGEAFRELHCVDIFRHKSLPAGRQAWLIRLRFQASDRTLTSEEVDGWMAAALTAAKALGAELRA